MSKIKGSQPHLKKPHNLTKIGIQNDELFKVIIRQNS